MGKEERIAEFIINSEKVTEQISSEVGVFTTYHANKEDVEKTVRRFVEELKNEK